MLNHPTLNQLQQMKFHAMARAFSEQLQTADIEALDFDTRFAMLVEREWTERRARQLTNRLRRAKLRHAHPLLPLRWQHLALIDWFDLQYY